MCGGYPPCSEAVAIGRLHQLASLLANIRDIPDVTLALEGLGAGASEEQERGGRGRERG